MLDDYLIFVLLFSMKNDWLSFYLFVNTDKIAISTDKSYGVLF